MGFAGGLWVFPEGPSTDVRAFCRKTFSAEIDNARKMPLIEHGFTHFRLNIRPIRCRVRRILPRAEAPGRVWLDVADAVHAAVPAPVKALLSGLILTLDRD